ncbi:metallophosphoesterase mpped2 [Plakobranchus ocellatus]|uniref:Metallophosphoesterase mpped2 n=1 Tax=Plakobranchus ocellatus TaxID=259542 RepID=A0AAV4CBH3_9GAST|nr:metallophosphoesterase mpped2 [Plakobranchus ocellatus]
MLNTLKSYFQSSPTSDPHSTSETYTGKIAIHPLTERPTKAWEKIKVKQVVNSVQPMDSDTEITEDKVRFVLLSDTHCQIEKLPTEFVPPADVLIHAGDFTKVGLPASIEKFDSYLGSLPHKRKIVIAGNHDLTLDMDMVNNRRSHLLNSFQISRDKFEDYLQEKQLPSSRELLKNCIYLQDSSITVCGIKIYGSPWQPEFGDWGFNLPRGIPCLQKWDQIPDETDILVTHGPPIGHGDLCVSGQRAGCVELLTTIQTRVKPKYHLYGHIHEAYGITTDGHTTFINGSNCTLRYKPQNKPVVFDFPIPEGHSKEELNELPVNNIDSL